MKMAIKRILAMGFLFISTAALADDPSKAHDNQFHPDMSDRGHSPTSAERDAVRSVERGNHEVRDTGGARNDGRDARQSDRPSK